MADLIYPSSLTGGRELVWLLTVRFAGRDWLFSSKPCSMVDASGNAYRFRGGIADVDYTDEFSLFTDTPAVRSVPFDVYWPEDVAALVAQGHDLGAATAEFAVWPEDGAYEDRVVLIDGYLVDPQYGENGETVSFSIEENPYDDGALFPPATLTVSSGGTWTFPASRDENLLYPWVFGLPGTYTTADGTEAHCSAVPVRNVDINIPTKLMLVAGSETVAGRAGVYVGLYDADDGLEESFVATTDADNDGNTVTLVNVSAAATITSHSEHEYWAYWYTQGGYPSKAGTGSIEGAGELLRYLLSLSTLRIDHGAFAAAETYLNRFVVAGYIDEQVSPYEWCRDNLLPLLPVALASGKDGLYPVVWRWEATADDSVAQLVDGRGLWRDGPVTYEGRDTLANEITLNYALRARTGAYLRSRTITGDRDKQGKTDHFLTLHSRLSRARYGQRAEAMETDIVYRTDVADLILQWLVMARGFVRRVITYQVDRRYAHLRLGDVVTLTSAALRLTDAVALVRGIRWTLSGMSVDLVLLEDPARDIRRV